MFEPVVAAEFISSHPLGENCQIVRLDNFLTRIARELGMSHSQKRGVLVRVQEATNGVVDG